MSTQICIEDPDQDYVHNWARCIDRDEISDILRHARPHQYCFSDAEIDDARENLNNKKAWKEYRYREFWSRFKTTWTMRSVPADARKAGPAPPGILHVNVNRAATPAFFDPKGILYYESADPVYTFIPMYVADVQSFYTREEFIKRFKRIMLPVLLNIVHEYWVVHFVP